MNTNRTNKGSTMIIHWPYSSLHYTPQITSNSTVQVTTEHKLYSNCVGRGEGDSSNYIVRQHTTEKPTSEIRHPFNIQEGYATHSCCHHHGPPVVLQELPKLLVPMAVVIKREAQLPDRLTLPLCAVRYNKLLLLNLFLELTHA